MRGGAGTALVGSYVEVADLIEEYHSYGFTEFVMSGYPHLEESYRFAELVFPLLAADRGRARVPLPGNVLTGPFGEMIANDIVPRAAEASAS